VVVDVRFISEADDWRLPLKSATRFSIPSPPANEPDRLSSPSLAYVRSSCRLFLLLVLLFHPSPLGDVSAFILLCSVRGPWLFSTVI
jgi:hypothetical protein